MNKIITMMIVSTLFSLQINANSRRFTVEVSEFNSLVNIYKLVCVVPTGRVDIPMEDRIYTQLTDIYFVSSDNNVDAKHDSATMKGCDLETLDQLQQDSLVSFGHVDVKVKLTKETTKKPFMYNGKCVHNVIDTLELDLGRGIVLNTGGRSVLKDASGCK